MLIGNFWTERYSFRRSRFSKYLSRENAIVFLKRLIILICYNWKMSQFIYFKNINEIIEKFRSIYRQINMPLFEISKISQFGLYFFHQFRVSLFMKNLLCFLKIVLCFTCIIVLQVHCSQYLHCLPYLHTIFSIHLLLYFLDFLQFIYGFCQFFSLEIGHCDVSLGFQRFFVCITIKFL